MIKGLHHLKVSFMSRRVVWILVTMLILLGTTLAQADDPNRVALVVVHSDGSVIKQCVEFSEDEITGYDVLERSGLDLNADVNSGGSAICRIDNEGCTYPAGDCFCQCQGSPCVFWIYWHWLNGQWQFSNLGASNRSVHNGDVEAWVWGAGSQNSGGQKPPNITFDDVCPSLATATPTSTQTPIATYTPEPTKTATPTSVPAPTVHSFVADQSTINSGESTILRWDLSGADAAYLRYDGVEEGVISPGSKSVSPVKTTVYTLVARNDGGEASTEITIIVNATTVTTTAAPSPTIQPDPPTPLPASIIDTAVPEPVINFSTASATLSPGACTRLQWEVENGTAIYLDEIQVDAHGSQQACPQQTQTYILRAVYPGGEKKAQLELVVVQATAVVGNTSIDQKVVASMPTATLLSTVTPTPEATLVSQNILKIRPPKDRTSTDNQTVSGEESSGWIRLGIWGTLVGGWCLIGAMAMVVFGGVWWFTVHKHK